MLKKAGQVVVGAIQGEGGPIYWLSMTMAESSPQ